MSDPTLPPIADFNASTVTELQFRTALSALRSYLAGGIGTTGTPAAVRAAMEIHRAFINGTTSENDLDAITPGGFGNDSQSNFPSNGPPLSGNRRLVGASFGSPNNSRGQFVVDATDPTRRRAFYRARNLPTGNGGAWTPWREVAEQPTHVVFAERFGARPDLANNTTAINAAIDHVAALGGGVVQFHGGVYNVSVSTGSTAIALKAGVVLDGGGPARTTIRLNNSQAAHVIVMDTDAERLGVVNLTVDGNRANQASDGGTHGIRMQGNRHVILDNLVVKECRYYGIGGAFTAGVELAIRDSRFTNLLVHDCGRPGDGMGDGIDIKRSQRCLFQNIRIYDCEQRGLDVRGEQCTYDSVWAYGNGQTGISLRALANLAETITDTNWITATNCFAFENGDQGFFISGNEGSMTGIGCDFSLTNCHAWGNTLDGFIHRGKLTTIRYTSCMSRGNGNRGFRADDSNAGDQTCRAIYTSCSAIGNTMEGFRVFAAIGPHRFIGCEARDNADANQVFILAPGCSWNGGLIDTTSRTRGLYVTGAGFEMIGGHVLSAGSSDGVRIDAAAFTVAMVRFTQGASTTALRLNGSDGQVLGCDFTEVTTGTRIQGTGTGNSVLACAGIQSSGRAVFVNGDVNRVELRSAATGQPPEVFAEGTNASVDLRLTPKGTDGRVRFGTHAAIGAETVTGFIEVRDSAGTLRKLAVLS